ncbi:Snf7-domain-containing protein [Delitschia confertaspora ATCC 74209]|uniref:Vacuolar-sorting protein SNF7 n=1 Tax=Delitschia confertaspora ATCC 74209 TaxID=1513339 RepID=A0A9P4JQ27_9PLEO|nr:Snf7-domain-containing protein [Delitschia confertaspora ATCC 74209]
MSGWGFGGLGSLFGGSKAKQDAPKKAILQLRGQLEMLNKREKHLHTQAEEQQAIARKYANTNKTAAKAALMRKKQFEKSLEQTSTQIMSLEREIHAIESANINKETMEAMRNAGQAMKQIHAGMTIDKVDQAMEDLREQHAIGEEINAAISQQVGTDLVDEEELDDELAELQQEELDNKMLSTGTVPTGDKVARLPSVATKPQHVQAQEVDDEEEELRKLQAEMAI